MRMLRTLGLVALASGLWSVAPASAQPLGIYRWQLQPYCNLISVTVVQQGGQYQLDGTDNQCGNPQAASVRGLAFFNPNGTIGFGLSIVTAPGGTPVHVDATIDIVTLGGTWRDSAGNTGTFVFTPGAPLPGSPRPVPSGGLAPGSVTNIQIANNAVTSVNVVDGSLTTADFQGAPRAAFASGDQFLDFSTATVVRSVTLNIPTAGVVIVSAGGSMRFSGTTTAQEVAQCSITTGTAIDSNHQIISNDGGSTAAVNDYHPMGSTRGFNVTAGTFTVNLVCAEAAGDAQIVDSTMTALFIGQ